MAKKRSVRATDAPSSLTMALFAPGMSILHRAGLGGLACTLDYFERAYHQGILFEEDLPGDWSSGSPPWDIDEQSVTLHFGEPTAAGEYLKRLFRIAFDIKDGLIYLPGQYAQEPSIAVRAELQLGLTLTFLQHGKVRVLDKNSTVIQCDTDGNGTTFTTTEFKRCRSFKHQEGWKELVDKQGRISLNPIEVIGPLSPGSVVRHVAFTSTTKLVDRVEHVLPLYFSLVGCLALPVNRGVGTLVVPDVEHLLEFLVDRPRMTPTTARECRVSERSDAVMQAKVRLRAYGAFRRSKMPAFLATTFKPTSWASQQKSRTWTRDSRHDPPVARFEEEEMSEGSKRLEQFEVALAVLPPRIRTKAEEVTVKQGTMKIKKKVEVAFWTDSVVRSLIAENLARGQPWYRDFTSLMRDTDANGTPYRHRLISERQGIHAMTQTVGYDYEREKVLVSAVHRAIRSRMGQIKQDTDGKGDKPPSPATKNRWKRFREELRLDLVGAKTPDQTRSAICELFGRAGTNNVLQEGWEILLPLLSNEREWRTARDLALLALASYSRQDENDDPSDD